MKQILEIVKPIIESIENNEVKFGMFEKIEPYIGVNGMVYRCYTQNSKYTISLVLNESGIMKLKTKTAKELCENIKNISKITINLND